MLGYLDHITTSSNRLVLVTLAVSISLYIPRHLDHQIEKNGTTKLEPYLKNEPFSSYWPNRETKKWPKSQITLQTFFWGVGGGGG